MKQQVKTYDIAITFQTYLFAIEFEQSSTISTFLTTFLSLMKQLHKAQNCGNVSVHCSNSSATMSIVMYCSVHNVFDDEVLLLIVYHDEAEEDGEVVNYI